MTLRWHLANRFRFASTLAVAMLMGSAGPGCGEGAGAGAGASPLNDPQIESAIKAVEAGKEDPRKLRNLIKQKMSGKEQEKAVPKIPTRTRRTR